MTNAVKEMNIEDLEIVTGGTIGHTDRDGRFLAAIGVMDSEFGTWDTTFHWNSSSKKLDDAWNKVGVRCVSSPVWDNVYYINGKPVSRENAIKYVAKSVGYTGSISEFLD